MAQYRALTLATLTAHDACAGQVRLFSKLYGNSLNVTVERCVAVAERFDWDWASRYLLSAPALAEYERVRAPAWAEYQRVRAPAWAEYERVRAPAWAEYDRVWAPARAEYQRVRAPAWAEYQRVSAPAWAEYDRVSAAAFASAYVNDIRS
jgi:hypothetical protein